MNEGCCRPVCNKIAERKAKPAVLTQQLLACEGPDHFVSIENITCNINVWHMNLRSYWETSFPHIYTTIPVLESLPWIYRPNLSFNATCTTVCQLRAQQIPNNSTTSYLGRPTPEGAPLKICHSVGPGLHAVRMLLIRSQPSLMAYV